MNLQAAARRRRGLVRWTLLCCLAGGGLAPCPTFAQPLPGGRVEATLSRAAVDEVSETLKQAGLHLSVISAAVMPAVVSIDSKFEKRYDKQTKTVEETGSGVIMRNPRTPGVFVVTNRHVVGDASLNQIQIALSDGRVITPNAKLEDAESDLAVLRIEDPGIEPAQFGDSDNIDIGHFVLAMGSPFGLTQSVTLGIVSAKARRSLGIPGRKLINQDFLQTDAAINPGNSGGPLIDLNGRVIGINTAIASQGGGNEGIGFSIPSNLVQFVVSQLLETGRVRRGFLGVALDEKFDIIAARRYALDRKYGARVSAVHERTPAAEAGLRVDDIILNFNGQDVADENDLINRVSMTPINKRVRVVVLRNGRQEIIFVTLAERPNSSQSAAPLPIELKPPFQNSALRQIDGFDCGFSAVPLDADVARQIGYSPQQSGLLVQQVDDDRGDLQLYDVIEAVGRSPVSNLAEMELAFNNFSSSRTLVLRVRRVMGDRITTQLVLWRANAVEPMGAESTDAAEVVFY